MCCSTNASFYASHKPRFLFLAFIQFVSNSPHIQSCITLAKKNTLFTFCSSSSSSSPLSCYIITAAISKPRAAFLRPSRGDMTFMHQKLPREREELPPRTQESKRQDSPQSPRRFLRSESALFTRACVFAKHTRRHLLQPPSFSLSPNFIMTGLLFRIVMPPPPPPPPL